jgi:serine/threonine protein kinase
MERSVNDSDPIRRSASDARDAGFFDGWLVTTDIDSSGFWTMYQPTEGSIPEVGVKIHVSASVASAGDVLACAIPILTRIGVPFKHASSVAELVFLSSGKGGVSQIGKFLTAYPGNNEIAKKLAQRLHCATEALTGPRIRSEGAVAENSLVHYRYGGFSRRLLQLRTGRIVSARLGAGGALEIDDRSKATDAAFADRVAFTSVRERKPEGAHILRDKYFRVQELYRSAKGSTWLGFASGSPHEELLIIKEAYAYVMEGSDGLDARQRLRREAFCLKELIATGVTPIIRDFWEEEHAAFLVYEMVEGPTFGSVLDALAVQGLRPPAGLLRKWAIALCETIHKLHEFGYVAGDIKLSNLIFNGESFRLIDLELCGVPNSIPSGGMGTRGYSSPQQSDSNSARSYLDDVYSFGATLLAMATVTDASVFPDLLRVARLEKSRDPGNRIYSSIERCIGLEPSERFASMQAVALNLAESSTSIDEGTVPTPLTSDDFTELACAIGNDLAASAVQDAEGAHWVSSHSIVGSVRGRDLYAGSAGTALFLCALYDSTRKPLYLDIALQCGRWLATTKPSVPSEVPMPGLFFGECGPGLLYLKLYLSTGEIEWLSHAIEVSEAVAEMPFHSPDLMVGAAGTGLFHLMLWHIVHDKKVLNRAFREAQNLLRACASSRPTWKIPHGHESLSGNEYLGFAHGSAGIGYFLAECCLARYNEELAEKCAEVADWITAVGQPCLGDRSGLTWSATPADAPRLIAWCHGASGIARFLLKAYEVSANPEHLRAAWQAGNLLAVGATWNGTTQCHGLAGNVDVLIDISRTATSNSYLRSARRLGENLVAYRTERGWPSEGWAVYCPDLMVGQAGIGAAFMRLGNPDLPHLISCEAFSSR